MFRKSNAEKKWAQLEKSSKLFLTGSSSFTDLWDDEIHFQAQLFLSDSCKFLDAVELHLIITTKKNRRRRQNIEK